MASGVPDEEALVEFVARSNEALQGDDTVGEREQKAQDFKNQQLDASANLKLPILEAEAMLNRPVERLLRDLRVAVDDRELEQPRRDLADTLEQKARQLAQKGTGFEDSAIVALDRALTFLRQSFTERTKSQTDNEVVGAPNEAPPEDPRQLAREFVRQYLADTFEGAPRVLTPKELAAALGPLERQAFLSLHPEEQRFICSMDERHHAAYSLLSKPEQSAFRGLETRERARYLAMAPDERLFFTRLKPDERAAYLLLHPEQRQLVRERGKEGMSTLRSLDDKRFASLASKDPSDIAQEISTELVGLFGHDPKAKSGNGRTNRRAAMSRASALVANFLREQPDNVAHARLATLKVLLSQPEFQARLISELEVLITRRSPALLKHFKKIRWAVIEHAQRILQPDTDRDSLLEAVEQAVLVSKKYADKHPPRRRELRVLSKLKFQRLITS